MKSKIASSPFVKAVLKSIPQTISSTVVLTDGVFFTAKDCDYTGNTIFDRYFSKILSTFFIEEHIFKYLSWNP